MAFELLFEEGTKPGSRQVFEKLLEVNDADDVKRFFAEARTRIYQQLDSIFGEEVRKQIWLAARQVDNAVVSSLAYCRDASLSWQCRCLSFKTDNELKKKNPVEYIVHLFEHLHNHGQSCDTLREVTQKPRGGGGVKDGRITGWLSVDQAIGPWASITKETPSEVRFGCLLAVELLVPHESPAELGQRFVECIEENEFLVNFVTPSNFDFFEMELSDQAFFWYILRLLSQLVRWDRKGQFVKFLVKRGWYTQLMAHLATFVTSQDKMADLIQTDMAHNLLLAFSNAGEPFFKGEPTLPNSIWWFCNAFGANLLLEWDRFGHAQISTPAFLFEAMERLINQPKLLLKSIEETSGHELCMSLDLLSVLATTNLAVCKKKDFEHFNFKDTSQKYNRVLLFRSAVLMQVGIMGQLENTPDKAHVIYENQAFFVLFARWLKYFADIASSLTSTDAAEWVALLLTGGLRFLFSEAAPSLGKVSQIVEVEQFRKAYLGAFFRTAFDYGVLTTNKLGVVENYMTLRTTAAVFCVVSYSFLAKLVSLTDIVRQILSFEGLEVKPPFLAAVVLKRVLVNEQIRKEWSTKFGSELRALACSSFAKFMKGQPPLDIAINCLVIFNCLVGNSPTPLVDIDTVLKDNGKAAATSLKLFVWKLLPNRMAAFMLAPSLSLESKSSRAKFPAVWGLFHKIGTLQAGITLATCVNSARSQSFRKILKEDGAGLAALIAKMREAIEGLSAVVG